MSIDDFVLKWGIDRDEDNLRKDLRKLLETALEDFDEYCLELSYETWWMEACRNSFIKKTFNG